MSHIKHLLSKAWYLLETRPEHPFYVSDNPVVLENRNDFGVYGNIGLAVPGIQIYLPLSSTLMLAMYCPSIREQKVREKQHLLHLIARAPDLIPDVYKRQTMYCPHFHSSRYMFHDVITLNIQ